jgi:hypothetical protein
VDQDEICFKQARIGGVVHVLVEHHAIPAPIGTEIEQNTLLFLCCSDQCLGKILTCLVARRINLTMEKLICTKRQNRSRLSRNP